MSDAWAILAEDTYKGVISGMVYGPHTVCPVFVWQRAAAICSTQLDPFFQDVSLKDFVASTPAAYDVLVYPDVCHTIYCQ